jgi:hypothetical protein
MSDGITTQARGGRAVRRGLGSYLAGFGPFHNLSLGSQAVYNGQSKIAGGERYFGKLIYHFVRPGSD